MTLLRFTRASDNKITGLLNWFPVHGTSLYRNNTHVAGDNKGLAAWMTEQAMREDSAFAGNFVAAFSQANLGDATPNTEGAWCEDGSGKQCDFETATCADGTVAKCQGRGPHWQVQDQGASSCHEIALRQLRGVKEILVSINVHSHGLSCSRNTLTWSARLPCPNLPLLFRGLRLSRFTSSTIWNIGNSHCRTGRLP